jgi:hypothetical protein
MLDISNDPALLPRFSFGEREGQADRRGAVGLSRLVPAQYP